MNPQFDEVLLTAYLDNEVTDEERTRVEEQLQSSEASRKLLEELRSVRNLVAQLHQSQPARRFQQGPWNEPALPEVNGASLSMVAPRVVLNETSWYRRVPLQRLASLAALIAIAVCASVLLIGPNTKSISLSENRSAGTTTDATVAPSRPLSELARSGDFGFQKKEELDGASAMDPKSKLSETLAFNPPPAPAPAIANAPPAMPSRGTARELKPGVEGLIDDLQVVEDFVKLDSSGTLGSNESKKEIFFRFGANKTDQPSDIASLEKALASPKFESLGRNNSMGLEKQRVAADGGIETGVMLVEFQIPIENWESGSKRLRKLGMDLPEKLPTVETLEFTAIPIARTSGDSFFNAGASESLIDRFVVDMKGAKEVVLSQWGFQAVAPQEMRTLAEIETPAKVPAAKDKKENGPSSSTIRIRVRPIK